MPSCVCAVCLQQQLQPNTVAALRKAVPGLKDADVNQMMRAPMRCYDPNNMQVGSRGAGAAVTQEGGAADGLRVHPEVALQGPHIS